MQVPVKLLPAVLALTTICAFTSCEKAFDYLKEHPGENVQFCPVQKLVFSQNGQQLGIIGISYNAAGNPTNMVTTSGTTGQQQYHFRYDKYGRLSDYLVTYFGSAGGVVTWDEYTYPDKNTVIDTMYAYTGNLSDPVHPHDFSMGGNRVNTYKLDASGRIIKSIEAGAPPFVTNFTYDAHGNLVRPGITYDNKVNAYQTNKVWMFINKDYSVNNPLENPIFSYSAIQITSYNSEGLPLVMNASFQQGGFLFGYDFTNLQLVYNCDPSKASSY